jgi:hypothetical protein
LINPFLNVSNFLLPWIIYQKGQRILEATNFNRTWSMKRGQGS